MIMDRAYEGAETRQLVLDLGFTPVVPPKQSRVNPWEYDRIMYRRRNEIERLFRRLKGFREALSKALLGAVRDGGEPVSAVLGAMTG